MRSHEFVTETITVADYRDQFELVLAYLVKRQVHALRQQRGTKAAVEHRALAVHDDLGLYDAYINEYFARALNQGLTAELSRVTAELLKGKFPDYAEHVDEDDHGEVWFTREIFGDGATSGTVILIHTKFLDSIVHYLVDYMFEYRHIDRDQYSIHSTEYDDVVDDFFNAVEFVYKDFGKFRKLYLDLVIDKMASVLTHEFVHLIQHFKQLVVKKRSSTEYRSYLEPNQAKFDTVVQNLSTQSPQRDFDIYHASPQEVTAFATNLAEKIIKARQIDAVSDFNQLQLGKIIRDQVARHLGYDNRDTNPRKRQIFNRYAKQVYQILADYQDKQQQIAIARAR